MMHSDTILLHRMNDSTNKSLLNNRTTKIQINVYRQCLYVKCMKTSMRTPKHYIELKYNMKLKIFLEKWLDPTDVVKQV